MKFRVLNKSDIPVILRLYNEGNTPKQIAEITQIDYANVYYHIRASGALTRQKFYRKPERFNYKDYFDCLKKKCCKLVNKSTQEFDIFIRTQEGENLIIRESRYYTPKIYLQEKEDEAKSRLVKRPIGRREQAPKP